MYDTVSLCQTKLDLLNTHTYSNNDLFQLFFVINKFVEERKMTSLSAKKIILIIVFFLW